MPLCAVAVELKVFRSRQDLSGFIVCCNRAQSFCTIGGACAWRARRDKCLALSRASRGQVFCIVWLPLLRIYLNVSIRNAADPLIVYVLSKIFVLFAIVSEEFVSLLRGSDGNCWND